jgi:hypothetical protein
MSCVLPQRHNARKETAPPPAHIMGERLGEGPLTYFITLIKLPAA